MFQVRSQMVGARSLFVRSTVSPHMLFDIGEQVRAHTLRTNCCGWVEFVYVILEMFRCQWRTALWTKNVFRLSIRRRVTCASTLSPLGSLGHACLHRLFDKRWLHRLGRMLSTWYIWRLLNTRGALASCRLR